MVAKVIAYIEFDPKELIRDVADKYDIEISDVTMDDIAEYVNNNLTYLDNKFDRGKWLVGDGTSIAGFEWKTYEEIQDVLDRMQAE